MEQSTTQHWRDVPTTFVDVSEARFALRQYGAGEGVPLVALTHLGANLDSWDPAVVDALARDRRLIAIDYRGVGASSGQVRDTIEGMAADVIDVITTLGHEHVDLFGLSMGGMVVQAILEKAPGLARRIVLAGSGPRHGQGLLTMTGVFVRGAAGAVLTRQDPKAVLFFTQSRTGRAAALAYLGRLSERSEGRDVAVTPAVFRAQLRAVHRWGAAPAPTSRVQSVPTLLFHGENDQMVPVGNASAMRRLLPDSTLTVFPDSGHGVIFQHAAAITDAVRIFLRR